MGTPENGLKILMLPWLAHGHISPFLELAKKLTKRNIFVYLCSTPVNLSAVAGKLLPPYSHSIKLVDLHLPPLPNLPPHYHTTNGLPPHLMSTLKKAFRMSESHLSEILRHLKPDFVIHDILAVWVGGAAAAAGVPAIDFLTAGATMGSFFVNMIANRGSDYRYPEIYLHEYEKARLVPLVEAESNVDYEYEDVLGPGSCNIRLIKSFKEIEGKYIEYFAELTEKPVIPVGPLIEEPPEDDNSLDLMQWLDKKDKGSSIFVSFGSEYFLTGEEMKEIAYGLELSNVNFIWVLRFPKEKEEIRVEEALPRGFIERVGERGKIVKGWAPQVMILKHASIGGFISHCGWGSVLESMRFGVPIIAMPMQLDQPLNSRLVVEVGVAIEVTRESKSGRLDGEAVAKAVREVVVEKGGEGVRRRAKDISEEMRLKGEEEIDELVRQLVHIYEEGKSTI